MPTNEYDGLIDNTKALTPTNEYDSIIQQQDDSASSDLRSSMKVATKKNPDQQAKVIQLADKAGLPPDTVERNTADVQSRLNFESTDYDKLLKDNPVLAQNLSDPNFASIAHDDIKNLSFWEETAKSALNAVSVAVPGTQGNQVLTDILRSVPGGLLDATGMGLRGIADVNDAVGRTALKSVGLDATVPADSFLANPVFNKYLTPSAILRGPGEQLGGLAADVKPPQERQNLTTDIAAGIGQITGQIGVSLVNPAVGLAFLFGQGADQQAQSADQAGATQEEKDKAVLQGAAVTGITEKVGLDALLDRLPPKIKNNIVKQLTDIAIGGGIEAVQEVTEGILQNMISLGIYDSNQNLLEGLDQQAYAAGGAGAVFRAIINAFIPGKGTNTQAKQDQVNKSVTNKEFLDQVGQSAKDSKLRERSPEKYRKLVADSLVDSGIENVGIPADQLNEFFQNSPDALDDFRNNIEGFEESLATATALGEDVQIPTDVLAAFIAPKEYYDALSQDIRLSADSMTLREAESFNEAAAAQIQADYQQYADQIINTHEGMVSSELVFNDVKAQLIAAGQPEDIASKNAMIHKAFFETMAARTGIDAFSLYQGQNLKIRSEQQQASPIDTVINALRTGKGPTDQQASGPSLVEFLRNAGGIQDTGGELKARDVDKGKAAFVRNLINDNGMEFDAAVQAAVDAGYIPAPDPNSPTDFGINELIDMIDSELGGNPIYSDQFANYDLKNFQSQLNNLDDVLSQAGLDINTMTNQEVKDFLDGIGGQSFDQVKPNEVFYVSVGDQRVEIIQNPTSNDISSVISEVRKEFPNRFEGDPTVRWTTDETGNRYMWKAHQGVHQFIEPEIVKKIGENVDQNNPVNRVFYQSENVKQAKDFLDQLSDENMPEMLKPQVGDGITQNQKQTDTLPESLKPQNGNPADPNFVADKLATNPDAFSIDPAKNKEFFQSADPEQSPEFIAWAGTDAPVIEPSDINDFDFEGKGPFVMRGYHGTTHTFTEFNASLKGTKEGQFGAVNYFTSDEGDADNNYAGEGPDLTQRIEMNAERVVNDIQDLIDSYSNESDGIAAAKDQYGSDNYNEDTMEFARNVARAELHGGGGHVLEVYIRTEKPFVVGSDKSPWIEFVDFEALEEQAVIRVAEDNDIEVDEVTANIDEYQDQVDEARWEIEADEPNKLIEAIDIVASRYDVDVQEILSDITDFVTEGTTQSKLEEALRASESIAYAEDADTGDLAGYHMLGEIIQELGFDSIILKNANERFKNMNMGSNTAHIHVFDENNSNIKSVDNQGTFSSSTANIYKQGETKKRGRIIFTNDSTIIDLFKDANLSTFLHESGHLFLNAFSSLAAQDNAPQDIKDDMAAILKWLEVDSIEALDPANNGEAAVTAQEKWARGIEAYLREGNAPSASLQAAFQRFKSWLINVYRSARNLNVELNDEIRAVMDRMLAVEDEINASQQRNNIKSVFEAGADITPEQAAKINRVNNEALETAKERLLVKLLKEITREKKQWWKDEKSRTRAQVEAEYHKKKEFKVKNWLQHGVLPDGSTLGIDPVKLSRIDLVEMYGDAKDALWRKLPFGKNAVWSSDGGVHPDVVAGMFGYRSGDEMVNAIVKAGNMKDKINQETDRRMLAEHGDILNDGSIEAEADDAMHNINSAEAMLNDINSLSKKTGRGTVPKQVFRNIARQIIASKRAADIKPAAILQNERRVTDKLLKAVQDGNDEEALKLANQRLINHFLYMEARDAVTRVNTIQKYMGAIVRRKYNPKAVDPDYINQLKLLASMYDFRKGKTEDVVKAQTNIVRLVEWIMAQQESGKAIYTPELISPDLARVSAMITDAKDNGIPLSDIINQVNVKSFKDMTVGELEDVYNTARHLRFVGGKNSENAREELRALAQDLADSIRDNGGKDFVEVTDKTFFDKVKGAAKRLSFDQIKLLSDINLFDGIKGDKADNFFGPMFDAIYQHVVDGSNKRIAIDLDAAERIAEIFKPMKNDLVPGKNKITLAKETGLGSWTLTGRERIMLAMYWGSPESRTAILEGHQVTENDVQKMLDKLTDKELDFVEKIWEFNESYWKELSRIEAAINGVPPVKVEHVPFTANGRTMVGGYFRLYYEWSVKDNFKIDMHDEANKSLKSNRVTQSKTGAVISRVGSGGRKVKLDPDSFFRAIEDNLQYIAFAEASREVARIAQHPLVSQAIVDKYGKDRYQSFIDSIDGVFAGSVANNNPINTMLRGVRTNLTFGYLALSVRNFVVQPIALTQAMGRIGEAETLKAMMQVYTHPKESWDLIKSKSVFMQQRNKFVNREAAEQLADLKGSSGLGWKPKWAFVLQTVGDSFATYPAWLAAYDQGRKRFAAPGISDADLEKKAVTYADEMVASTVGSGLTKDLAPLFQGSGNIAREVGSETAKQLTFMGSFFNMTYNLYYDAWRRLDTGSVKSELNFVREMAWYAVIPGILSAAILGDTPDDDEALWEWAIKKTLEFGFSASMFWRNMVSTLNGFEPNIPAYKAFSGAGRAANIAVDLATDQKDFDGETAAKLIRSFEPLFAMPGGGQMARTLEYLDSYDQGNEGEFSLHGMLIEGKDR